MLSEEQVQQIKAENELLHVQLQDLNVMIAVREEELNLLRETASYAISLQSRLDANLDEFEQMQGLISDQRRRTESALKREATLEEEMFLSVKMETDFYTLRDQLNSSKTALADLTNELDLTASLYKQISVLTGKISQLESNLEVARLDNKFLKEDLEQYRGDPENNSKEKL